MVPADPASCRRAGGVRFRLSLKHCSTTYAASGNLEHQNPCRDLGAAAEGGRPPTLLFAEVDEEDENSGGKPDNERLDLRLGSRCAGASDKNGSRSLFIMLGNGKAGRADEVSELDRDLSRAVIVLPPSMEDRGGSVNGGKSIGNFSYDDREADLSDADEDERLSDGSE